MTSLQFSQREIQLARERRLKFQGVAKVNLDEICFDSQSNRQLDQKNVERLCKIFREEGCQHLAVEHRIPATVSQRGLTAALAAANISAHTLQTHHESEAPHLRFSPGQLHGLHGRHRVAAGFDVLLPSNRWWAVDIYLDDVGEDLKTTLIEEYSNEKPPSDGEIYRKIRQYASDGNLHGELRWKARLSANNLTRFESLSKNPHLRHAFDGVLGIPGHRSAMRMSMLHRVVAVRCDEEIVRYLKYVRDVWYGLVNHDVASVAKIDQTTVEQLQTMAPRIEAREVRGLVLSGQVFSHFDDSEREAIWERLESFDGMIPSLHTFFEDFKCLESWAHCLSRLFPSGQQMRETIERRQNLADEGSPCLVQTSESHSSYRAAPVRTHFDLSYRQLWLYAMRHSPQMPRDPKRKDRLAKPRSERADEYLVSDMAGLAQRLRFQSDEITHLVNESPDRLIAQDALFRARKPNLFQYDDSTFHLLVDRIVSCFATATRKETGDDQPVFASPPVRPKARCGHPTERALAEASPFLFLDHMHATDIPDRVTSFYVRRCVYLAFFGPLSTPPGESSSSDATSHAPDGPVSPLFVPEGGAMDGLLTDGPNPTESVSQSRIASDRNQGETEQRGTEPLAEQERVQQEAVQRAVDSEMARLRQLADDMARRVAEAEEQAAQQSRHADEMAQRAQAAQNEMAVQAAELERLRTTPTERAHQEPVLPTGDVGTGDQQRPPDSEENVTSAGFSHVMAEEIDELLTDMLQADAEQRATGEQTGAPRAEESGSTLPIIQVEDELAAEQTEDPQRLTQWNLTELMAEMRRRDSADDDRNPAAAPRSSLQEEAEEEAAAVVVEPKRNDAHEHHPPVAAGSVASDANVVAEERADSAEEPVVERIITDRILTRIDEEELEEGAPAAIAAGHALVQSTIPPEAVAEEATDRLLPTKSRANRRSTPKGLLATRKAQKARNAGPSAAHQKRQGIIGGVSEDPEAHGEAWHAEAFVEHGDAGDHRPGPPVRGSRIQKKSQPRPTQKDQIRRIVRDTAIGIELEDRETSPREVELGTTEAESTTPLSPLGEPRVHFAASPPIEESEQGDAIPGTNASDATDHTATNRLTHYNFRDLARGTLTDPGRDDEAWPAGLSLPSVAASPPLDNGAIPVTFHIYEREGWKVAHVLSVHPSDRSPLETVVWGYKRKQMIVYNIGRKAVSPASSFRGATMEGANALFVVPLALKAQMNQGRIELPATVSRHATKKSRQ